MNDEVGRDGSIDMGNYEMHFIFTHAEVQSKVVNVYICVCVYIYIYVCIYTPCTII